MTVRHARFVVPPAGYQLPADVSLGHVALQVADLNRSLEYYQRVIGLRIISQTVSTARMGTHGNDSVIVELRAKPGVAAVPSRGRLGLYHFAILLPTRAALGQFLAHLGLIDEYAGMSDHLVSEALYLTDPDGLGIEVYADRPRDSWRLDGEAIAMATDPLDVHDLLAARGETPWSGIPVGTRIGHVHLYVDTLEKSEAFFHEALGFDKVVLQFPGALFLSAGGYHHHLGTNIWAARSPNATNNDARLLEWRIVFSHATDVKAAARSLEDAGFPVTREGESAFVTEPWGTRLRLTAEA
jgi:catechol 2,3-dioxygenase